MDKNLLAVLLVGGAALYVLSRKKKKNL